MTAIVHVRHGETSVNNELAIQSEDERGEHGPSGGLVLYPFTPHAISIRDVDILWRVPMQGPVSEAVQTDHLQEASG